nr:hypothetical protein [Tanacetum cinerariifolium]
MDEAFVPTAQRLRIGRSNFRLLSDIKSKESTLQLVYDVLRICPFFKAFMVTADVPEIYMQEFWATATVHHHAIRFKIDNNKYIIKLESFRDMLHICPRAHGQSFDEPLFEEDILAFICFLRHSALIRMLIDVNINKDDHMFSKIKLVSRHQNTQQFGALLPIELTNEEIKNSNAYKEYYAIATGAAPPKPKASTHISQASSYGVDEGTGSIPGVLNAPTDESEEELSWNSTDGECADNEGKDGDDDEEDEGHDGEEGDGDDDDEDDDGKECDDDDDDDDQKFKRDDDKDDKEEGGDDEHGYDKEEYDKETRDEESFDPIPQTLKNSNDVGNGDEDLGLNVGGEEGYQSSSASSQFVTSMLNPTLDVGMESIFETTSQMDVPTPTSVAPLLMTAPTMTPSSIATITTTSQAPLLPTTAPSTIIQNLPNFGSLFGFDNRLRTLEANFSESMQTNQFARAVSAIPGITVNEQLEAEVLTQSSHSSKTSYAVAADLLEMELKKILIKKMEGNKDDKMMMLIRMKNPPLDQTGGQRDVETERSLSQRALYQRLLSGVLAGQHKGLNLKSFKQVSLLMQRTFADHLSDQPIVQSSQHPEWFSQQHKPPSPDRDWNKTVPAIYRSIQPWISELVKQTDSLSSFNELIDTPLDISNFLINRLKYPHNLPKPLPLIPNNRGCHVIPFEHFINNDLEYLRGGASCRKYTTSIIKTKAADYGHIKWIEDLGRKRQQFYGFAVNRESARDVYSKRRIIAVTELKIIEWHNYKHLDWITVQRDDDKLYKFKEGDFKRLRIQDKKDLFLLLAQGKLTNLTVEERFAFNVSLRIFKRSIVIQRRVEDLQLGVKSYQKKLNLTKLDTYRSDLKRKKAYTAYFNLQGFIYQNKDKKNRLMRIDELHKFSDGTLIDVRTALDDRLKGIQMQYLRQSIWRKSDKDRAAAMIQAIDKRLKTKRIMRS